MPRAIVLLMDSFGIGSSADASKYGDQGANTFGHIVEYCSSQKTHTERQRSGQIYLPNLKALGLFAAAQMSTGNEKYFSDSFIGKFGYAQELSYGKDTPSGHWEIAGVPVLFDWGYFPPQYPSFPAALIKEFVNKSNIPGILGNRHASGTQIIEELGEEHINTQMPIVYTSADSVFQIAAHETFFGLERLYELCEIARQLVDPYNIGRVIARPFAGEIGHFYRTGNRRDYAMPPPNKTLLDNMVDNGDTVVAIGKTADIFAHQGISKEIKAVGNMAIFDATLQALENAKDRTLIFSNFVDFDSSYGHRRNVEGYAAALEEFDQRLPELDELLRSGDLVIITADHGCDPTWQGSDHTREHIPVLCYGPGIEAGLIGKRDTFADIGQTLAEHFGLNPLNYGISFLNG